MKHRMLMGLETELALSSVRDGETAGVMGGMLLRRIWETYPCLRDTSNKGGVFLSNGGRVYLDCGGHIEWATPEVTSPRDLVTYDKAGERLMAQTLRALGGNATDGRYIVKNNVDYAGMITYGSHENYLIRGKVEEIGQRLIPFLVTRPIFAGAGRVSSDLRGCGYELSQRAAFITVVQGSGTTQNRAIACTKNENLSNNEFNRLHLITGDSLMSETGILLRIGTTALMVIMADADALPVLSLRGDPLECLRLVSRCPDGKAVIGAHDETAIGIQRFYLTAARRFIRFNDCPDWAGEIVTLWEETLGALERDPLLLGQTLDCHVKKAYFNRMVRRESMTWELVRDWSHVRDQIVCTWKKPITTEPNRRSVSEVVPERVMGYLDGFMNERGLRWEDLMPMHRKVIRLKEADLRYHDITTERGIFYLMRSGGLLREKVVPECDIERAITEPPKDSRAFLRGQAVKVLAHGPAVADWTSVQSPTKTLDLSDPFTVKVL